MSQKFQLFVLVVLGCSFKVIPTGLSETDNVKLLQQDGDFSDFSPPDPIMPSFGTLHTLDKLIYWSRKEEEMYDVMQKKMRSITKEYGLINKFLGRYKVNLVGQRRHTFRSFHVLEFIRDLASFITIYGTNQQKINLNVKLSLELENRTFLIRNSNWPDSADLYVSQAAILLIHEYSSKMASQLIQITKFSEYLKAFECALIGLHALSRNLHYFSIEWLDSAVKIIKRTFEVSTDRFLRKKYDYNNLSINLVGLILKIAAQIHNNQLISKGDDIHALLDMYTGPVRLPIGHSLGYSSRIRLTNEFGGNYGNHSSPLFNMLAICSGARFQPEHIKSHLKCYLDKTKHPYFALIPLKTEQLSVHPMVLQFYDVLGSKIIAKLYNSREEVVLSPVITGTDKSKILLARSATGSFSGDEEALERVRIKGEMMTGMILRKELRASKAKLMEYTYGRHYAVHRDLISQRQTTKCAVGGDPVVTLLYYVETPTSGGDTPFSSLGIVANPVKGSVVMWINMFRNGTVREDIFHGSCPVLLGHKLVLNQWVDYHANFQAFKCSLNQFY